MANLMKNTTYVFSNILSRRGINIFKSSHVPNVTVQFTATGVIKVFDGRVCLNVFTSQTSISTFQVDFLEMHVEFTSIIQDGLT